MALVYSYVRFSTKKQLEGDSLKRQVELGDEWIKRNGHTKALMLLQDLGLSSFRGENKISGKLRGFLQAIESGQVKPGDMLLVENLDRLSRQSIDEAYDLFKQILKAGVLIVVLKPYEIVYDKRSLNDFVGMLIPLLYFHLAHIESKNKSGRLASVWNNKREKAGDGKPLNSICPSWITWTKATNSFALNDGVTAVRWVFDKTVEGWGQKRLVAGLQKEFKPIGRSGKWNGSFVQKVLSDRSVLGERQNYTFTESGDRVPIGKVIPGYYPAAIDESLWHRAQSAKAQRTRQKGPNKKFVNLFTGLLVNAHDGHQMHIQTTKQGKGKQRRLVSYGHLESIPGSDRVSVNYWSFEVGILRHLEEAKVEFLESKVDMPLLRTKEQERKGIEQRLAELQAELADPNNKGTIRHVLAAIAKLEENQASLYKEINVLYGNMNSSKPLVEAQSILEMMFAKLEGDSAEDYQAFRMRLRVLIAELVETIHIKPEKHFGRVYFMAQITFRNGMVRTIASCPGAKLDNELHRMNDQEMRFDLTNREFCNANSAFVRIAELIAEPTVYVPPVSMPSTIGPCRDVWLGRMSAKMIKNSFRIIPPKVQWFVDFCGLDLPVADLRQHHWDVWVRTLRLQVAEGQIQRNTARVTYGRVREFVRWLIENAGAIPLDGLDLSGEAALG